MYKIYTECAQQSALQMCILFHSIILLTACQLHSIYMHTFKKPNLLACGICGDAHVTLSTSPFKEALSLEHQAIALPRQRESSLRSRSIKRYRENILQHEAHQHEPHLKTFSHCIFAVAVSVESDKNNPQPQLLFFYYFGHFFPFFPVSLESPAFTGMIKSHTFPLHACDQAYSKIMYPKTLFEKFWVLQVLCLLCCQYII